MQQKRKFNYMNLLLILVFVVGLGILLYPNISDFINQKNSSKAISKYDETVAQMSKEEKKQWFSKAGTYNETLLDDPVGRFADMTKAMLKAYMEQLNIDGKGMMCYIKIDKINLNAPVYHGTTEDVLQHYIGHLEGTSLPIGGPSTHSAMSGHRGLPSAVLFTNLDRMEVGDQFSIIVLGEEHIYEVDQIVEVLPNDMSPLAIEKGKDYCTLITCTPYGVNTHRLMVRGIRIGDGEVSTKKEDDKKFMLTREQIVLIIAAVMSLIFLGVAIPLFILPVVVPGRRIILRPWDDTLVEVIDAADTISKKATRANWATEDVAFESDRLAELRKWDETMNYKQAAVPVDEKDIEGAEDKLPRDWLDYHYEDETDGEMSKTERDKFIPWDNDILEKVDQDWSELDREGHKVALKFTDIQNIYDEQSNPLAKDVKQKYMHEKAKASNEAEIEWGKQKLKKDKN